MHVCKHIEIFLWLSSLGQLIRSNPVFDSKPKLFQQVSSCSLVVVSHCFYFILFFISNLFPFFFFFFIFFMLSSFETNQVSCFVFVFICCFLNLALFFPSVVGVILDIVRCPLYRIHVWTYLLENFPSLHFPCAFFVKFAFIHRNFFYCLVCFFSPAAWISYFSLAVWLEFNMWGF